MFAAVVLAVVLIIPLLSVPVQAEEGETRAAGDAMLIDMGNGVTYWTDLDGATGSCVDIVRTFAEDNDLDFDASGDTVTTIGEMTHHSVGGQECGWLLYRWDGSAWSVSEDVTYSGGSIAWGFYPDPSITPVETPDSPTAWTQHRGDSESSGNSDSFGTIEAKSPMEWYRTYTSGYVDSAIIVAGDYLYHTTGGAYGNSGADGNPWVHCLNRFTGDIVWEFMMTKGAGYEVTSPLVVGDMLIVTATNYNVYLFDRFTGEVLDTLTLDSNPPMDSQGNIVWDGRTFYTGGTTPVYDSGAVYFGTHDGHVMAYSVTRGSGFEQLWDYDPDDSVSGGEYTGTKGCFYYHAPVIADIDGTRMLFIGSYEGYVHALDASTGEEIWVQRMIDLGEENIPHKGTPGSAGAISVTQDGRLLIQCTDGGMSAQDGYTLCVDASTGRGPDGSDYYWKLDAVVGGPVVTSDSIYAYIQPSVNGAATMTRSDGTQMELMQAIYRLNLDGEVEWVSGEYNWIKSSLTLADGVLYAVDYSAGEYWPDGGGITAISAEDGSEIWRLKLSPSSKDNYNMVAVTVIDGKLYVGNDYGAVYCVSDVAGPQIGDEGEIVLENGFHHWSWYALILVVVLALFLLWRLY